MNEEPHGLCHISEVINWILIHQVISMEKIMCAKCGKVEVSYEGAYCDECKGTFEERCNNYRSTMNAVKETGDWRKDWKERVKALNSMFR